MPPKTIKKALVDVLEDLSKQDFDKFCCQLLDRREQPRVRRNRVEGKNFLYIADVLVSTFTESGAVGVAVELLKEINCYEEADRLVEETSGLSSRPESSGTAGPSAGASGVTTMAHDEHFVDKHQVQLIKRVSNISPILDELLHKKVIDQEQYDEIRALPTSQGKMRELYSGCLKAGTHCKDIFYKILEKNEPYLIADLKKSAVPTAGASGVTTMAEGGGSDKHFVDKHQFELIRRVHNVGAVLDELVHKNVIQQESYDEIRALPTSQEKMRALFRGPLESSGVQEKDILYKILNINEPDLMADLKRMDLEVATLTAEGLSLGTEEKHSADEEQPSLIQRVETMASVIELLLETLADLSYEELEMVRHSLSQFCLLRHHSNIPWRLRTPTDMKNVVFLMVQIHGQMSVEKTVEVLKKMKRTDLVQRLLHSRSGAKKKHSVDERLPAQIHKVAAMTAVTELLFETLKNLSYKEQKTFRWFLHFTLFQRSFLCFSWGRPRWAGDVRQLAELMVEICGQRSLEVTMEVFMEMKRPDLVQRLPETSSAPKAAGSSAEASGVNTTEEENFVDEHWPALTQKVEAMVSVIELLLETLKDLSDRMSEFRGVLWNQADFHRHLSKIRLIPLHMTDMQDMVFLVVLTFGQQSVEMIKGVLEQMRRTDLVHKLSDQSLKLKKRHSADEQRSALIQRVATIAVVKQLLVETLNDLHDSEYKKFRRCLQLIVFRKDPPGIFIPPNTADLMVQTFGQRSVELTRDVFVVMNRADLVQRLSSSASKNQNPFSPFKFLFSFKKHSVDEHRPALFQRVAAMAAVKKMLLKTVSGLSQKDFENFSWLLQFTCFQKSLPQVSWRQVNWTNRTHIVDAMVQTCGQQSVEVTMEVFKDMNRTDLVQRLSQSSSQFKEEHQPQPLQKEVNMISLQERLLETLENVSSEELQEFKLVLRHSTKNKGLPGILIDLIDDADRIGIVEAMAGIYGEDSEGMIRKVLKAMKRRGTEDKHSVDKHRPALSEKGKTMTSLKQKILEALKDLSSGELEKFRHVLQYGKMKEGLPRIPRHKIEMADRSEIVEVMVEIYGEESEEVIRNVLTTINRSDLVQRLSVISSGSTEPGRGSVDKVGVWLARVSLWDHVACSGPSRSLEHTGCGSIMQDSSDWTKLEPEVNSTDADETPTYSLRSEAGRFECSVSGIRWLCQEKVGLKYQFCSWEEPMERMENIQYMPAGPLIDITVIAGKLAEIYLPHWICIDDIPKISDKFAVLHINDCGDVVEKVSEVTPSHVKLPEPDFSPRAVLMKAGFPVKISCNVLIYYKPNTPFLKLHVYVIPHDPALQQAVDKKKFSDGYKKIQKPRPDNYLKMQHGFILTANIDTANILPEKITLRYDSQDPNFYEVFIENPDRNFHLTLAQKNKQQCEPVWTCEIRKDDYQNSAYSEEKHFVDEHLPALMQKVATITTNRERLSNALTHLKQEELKEFKWFLQDSDFLAGLPCIPRGRLENGDRLDLVDQMVQTYGQQSMEVAKKVFKKINRKDLVKML
ncbi:uncharacterized protein LOC121610260 [Chelmon rostratus]|uniref:uncharacterized protein LOC121610260 n=1 Tax=Chelmon rostratus TaxID=109905 RepID=UPI001BE62FCB|nr:uncharacterized protein LOC121610260 [Chelmon rostratus]